MLWSPAPQRIMLGFILRAVSNFNAYKQVRAALVCGRAKVTTPCRVLHSRGWCARHLNPAGTALGRGARRPLPAFRRPPPAARRPRPLCACAAVRRDRWATAMECRSMGTSGEGVPSPYSPDAPIIPLCQGPAPPPAPNRRTHAHFRPFPPNQITVPSPIAPLPRAQAVASWAAFHYPVVLYVLPVRERPGAAHASGT